MFTNVRVDVGSVLFKRVMRVEGASTEFAYKAFLVSMHPGMSHHSAAFAVLEFTELALEPAGTKLNSNIFGICFLFLSFCLLGAVMCFEERLILVALKTDDAGEVFVLPRRCSGWSFCRLADFGCARAAVFVFTVLVVFQLFLGRKLLLAQLTAILVVSLQVRQVLLVSQEELATSGACVLGRFPVFVCVLLEGSVVLQDIATLKADDLVTRGVLRQVSPQTRLLYKLAAAEVTGVVFLCRRYVVHVLKVVNQQSPLCKLCITLVTVVVRVAQPVLVQLKCRDECLTALFATVNLCFLLF